MATPQARRAVLYGRVSKLAAADRRRGQTTEQGKSVDQQLELLRKLAGRDQVDVVAEHRDDGVSASRYANGRAREGWQDTMDLITAGEVTELWVWEISRATRDRPVWSALVSACMAQRVLIVIEGKVHDPNDPDDGFILDLLAALAVRESAVTSKRIKRDVRAAAAQGRPHGRIPYGYLREYDTTTRALNRQYPDPATAPIVAEIIARVADEESGYSIAGDLNLRGEPTPHQVRAARLGQDVDQPYPWTLEQVFRVARNPTYAGLRAHDEGGAPPGRRTIVATGTWDPIVERELWDRAQLVLSRPGRPTRRESSTRHLLTGIATCGICHSRCRVVKNRGYLSYCCWGGPAKRGTSCVCRVQDPVDHMVTQTILHRFDRGDVDELFADAGSQDQVSEAKAELARLEQRLEEYRASADDPNGISAAALARAERALEPMIEAARARSIPRTVPPLIRAGLEAPDKWVWWHGDPDQDDAGLSMLERRLVVRTLVTVEIQKSPYRNGTRGFDPSLITVEWRKRG